MEKFVGCLIGKGKSLTYPPELLPSAEEKPADIFLCADHQKEGPCPNCRPVTDDKTAD
jgi:hypothetical protein